MTASKTILLIIITILIISPSFSIKADEVKDLKNQIKRKWDINGITFIYLNGSFYEMGYQMGYLLKDKIRINTRAFEYFYSSEGIEFDSLYGLWNKQKKYVPQEMIDYIQGTADALNTSLEKIACTWVAEGLSYSRCCGMAAWGESTEDGELLSLRSMEFPLEIRDPVTHSYIQDSPIIVIAAPKYGNSFMYPTFAGYVCEGGINEKGITVSNMWSPNHDQKDEGCPMGIRLFHALYDSSNAIKAIKILTNNKTYGYNFIVSDANIPKGYAVETTANETCIGSWNSQSESNKPFKKIKQVVRRTNIFLNKKTAKQQRKIYNPKNIINIIGFILNPSKTPWYYVWNHYISLSRGIEKIWGNMNINNTMEMLRDVYKGKNSIIWKIILNICPKDTWWQWVATPKTGEIKIAFTEKENGAHFSDTLTFNLLKTLENKEPFIIS